MGARGAAERGLVKRFNFVRRMERFGILKKFRSLVLVNMGARSAAEWGLVNGLLSKGVARQLKQCELGVQKAAKPHHVSTTQGKDSDFCGRFSFPDKLIASNSTTGHTLKHSPTASTTGSVVKNTMTSSSAGGFLDGWPCHSKHVVLQQCILREKRGGPFVGYASYSPNYTFCYLPP